MCFVWFDNKKYITYNQRSCRMDKLAGIDVTLLFCSRLISVQYWHWTLTFMLHFKRIWKIKTDIFWNRKYVIQFTFDWFISENDLNEKFYVSTFESGNQKYCHIKPKIFFGLLLVCLKGSFALCRRVVSTLESKYCMSN